MPANLKNVQYYTNEEREAEIRKGTMVKLTVAEIIAAQDALGRLSQQPFPGLIAYQIQKNIKTIFTEFETYDKVRVKLVQDKYGVKTKDENGNETTKVPPKREPAFRKELAKIWEAEVEVPITKIKLESFPKEITPADMMTLEFMFDLESITGEKPKARKRHPVQQ